MGELDFSFSEIFSLIWQIVQNIWILTGAFLFVISFLIWLFIISKLQLNIAYPIIIGSEVVLVSLASWFLFKEYLSFFQILGILFVVLGIFLLSSKA